MPDASAMSVQQKNRKQKKKLVKFDNWIFFVVVLNIQIVAEIEISQNFIAPFIALVGNTKSN